MSETVEGILFVPEVSTPGFVFVVSTSGLLTTGCVSEGEESTSGSDRLIVGFNIASFVGAGVIGARNGASVGRLDGGRVGRGEGDAVVGLSRTTVPIIVIGEELGLTVEPLVVTITSVGKGVGFLVG